MHIQDEILTVGKQSALRFGGVQPMLFVEGTKGKVYIPLPFGETNARRIDIMFDAGITVARSGKVGDVGRVLYVTEAWVSPAREKLTKLPSEDPDRMESCSSTHWTPKAMSRRLKCMLVSGMDARTL